MSNKNKDYYCHNSSYVDENVTIGKDSKIWHFSHVMDGSTIGEKCTLGQNCFVVKHHHVHRVPIRLQTSVSALGVPGKPRSE